MSATPGLAIKSPYTFLSLSLFLSSFANFCSNPAPRTHKLVWHGTAGRERKAVCQTLICPSRSHFCLFLSCSLWNHTSSPALWLLVGWGQWGGPPEVRGRKWCEVRVSAPPAPSPPDQEQDSGDILLPSECRVAAIAASSTAVALNALREISICPSLPSAYHLFGSLNLAHPTHKTHWVIHLFPTRVDAGYM